MAFRFRPDLVLLDIMLPGMDGMSVCRELRANPETKPAAIVILTAKSDPDDVVAGLDSGANDYIAKPFLKEVHLARIRAALRKSTGSNEKRLSVDGLVLDITRLHERGSLALSLIRLSGETRAHRSPSARLTVLTVC